jgi:recombination protein RecR
MNIPSRLIEDAVNQFSTLPGIGKKTALRLVLHLLKQSPANVEQFGSSFIKMRNEIGYCKECNNISETQKCGICSDHRRDNSLVCVVQDIRDVLAIENTNQYKGLYHVLGGIISPMDGIGPTDLNIEGLLQRVAKGEIQEVCMALSTTMEGDTTVFYLYRKLKPYNITISTIARGVAIGDELEFTDEITLGRSITNRMPYENALVK